MTDYAKLYFDYLTNLIDKDDKIFDYTTLLEYLYYYDFVWLKNIPLDENREVDGIQLRNNFKKYLPVNEQPYFEQVFEGRDCSMLEMFVAFAERLTYIESDLTQPDYFWLFLSNLGISFADNMHFNGQIINEILQGFLYGKKVHPDDPYPPLMFPCREVYENLNKDLYMQANYYLKYYFL